MVFGHAAGNVSVMVLHLNARERLLLCPARGEVVGMKIAGEELGIEFEDTAHVVHSLFEKRVALEIFEITDVLAEKGLAAACEADSVLQFTADRENPGNFLVQENRHGNVAARTTHLAQAAVAGAHHGIIFANEDVAVVDEKKIGDAVQAADGFLIVDGNGFFAEIGARHYESA